MKMMKIKISFLLIIIVSLFVTKNVYADDYPDDIYNGNYSLEEMLQNYNVITFGKKDLDSRMTNLVNERYHGMPIGYLKKGDAKIFHINSQFLINGSLTLEGILSGSSTNGRMDLKPTSGNLKSCVTRLNIDNLYCGYFYNGQPNSISDSCNFSSNMIYSLNGGQYSTFYSSQSITVGNYMNFDRLYDSIINEQNKIKKGRYIAPENGVAHIEIGGEYYIDNINEIEKIMFDNFSENENNLTVITINNTGDIQFPKIFKTEENGEGTLVSTNDYSGMQRPYGEYSNFYVIDKYYGNIIWNIPNATYIELSSAPFIGHIIAPNADLYGPELHYAGNFIVNSLYLEGNSEAHFYPLTSTNIPYRSSADTYKAKAKIDVNQGNIQFKNEINPENLEEGIIVSFNVEPEKNYTLKDLQIIDEEKNNVEYRKIDTIEYEFTMPATDVTIIPTFQKRTITDIITNPNTGTKIVLFIVIIISTLFFGTHIYNKKESRKI